MHFPLGCLLEVGWKGLFSHTIFAGRQREPQRLCDCDTPLEPPQGSGSNGSFRERDLVRCAKKKTDFPLEVVKGSK